MIPRMSHYLKIAAAIATLGIAAGTQTAEAASDPATTEAAGTKATEHKPGQLKIGLDYVGGYSQTYNDETLYPSSKGYTKDSSDKSVPVRLRLGYALGDGTHGMEFSFNQLAYQDKLGVGSKSYNMDETLNIFGFRYVNSNFITDTAKINLRVGLSIYSGSSDPDGDNSQYQCQTSSGVKTSCTSATKTTSGGGFTAGLEGEVFLSSSKVLSLVAGYDYLQSFDAKYGSTKVKISTWNPSVYFLGIRANF